MNDPVVNNGFVFEQEAFAHDCATAWALEGNTS